ncbi:MAG: hypothetical protein WB615_14210 [Candidatus Tumulicola sp.]
MRTLAFAAAALLLGVAAPGRLVYAFDFESSQTDDADKAYGVDKMDPGGGGTFMFHNVNQHYRSPSFDAPTSRTGQIVVQVLRQESDGGLVLTVSEPTAAEGGDGPVTCVAFGDTTVVCDPSRIVAPEESALLPLLGKSFINVAQLDAARHWRTNPQGAFGTTADYTVRSNAGSVLEIDETAVRTRSGSALKTSIAAKIEYEAARELPIAVDETTVEQIRRGVISATLSTHTTLKLESNAPPK